jgi:hypothetical protein
VKSERERARRVLAAVRALPPGVLDEAAVHAPLQSAALIAAVRASLAAPDPEEALAERLRATEKDTSELARAATSLEGGVRLAAEAAEPARSSLEALLAGREQLAAIAADVRGAIPGNDPALATLVDDALEVLGDDGPFAVLKSAFAAVRGVQDGLAQLARGKLSPSDLAQRVGELRAKRDAIAAAAAGPELARIPSLVLMARSYAAARGDKPAMARLALADAAMHANEQGSDERWRDALELAIDARDLGVARHAAARIELAAAAAGRLDIIAETASQIGALAADLGDADAEISALGDQALASAQLGGQEARARELVGRAHALAADDAVRAGRVSLLEGQVLERLGDASGARRALRHVMDAARDTDGLGHELGWAALHLGRLEGAGGQPFRASQDLELAQQIGQAAGDATLYALAVGARIDLAPDRSAAEAVLGQAGGVPESVRAELRRRLDARWPVN